MKKILSVISLVLVFCVVALSFTSCANLFISQEALAAISDRVLEAVNKISTATALDAALDIKISVSVKQFSFVTFEIPVQMVVRYNMTDLTKPSIFYSAKTLVDSEALKDIKILDSDNIDLLLYYNSGTMYLNTNLDGDEIKEKYTSDFDSAAEIPAIRVEDMKELVFFDETMIKSASLKNGLDGSLSASVKVDGEKTMDAMFKLVDSLMGGEAEAGDDGEAEKAGDGGETGEASFNINDSEVYITVDKDNNVTNFRIVAGIVTPDIESFSPEFKIDINVDFNPVGADYVVPAPDDLDSYVEESKTEPEIADDKKKDDSGTEFPDIPYSSDGDIIYRDASVTVSVDAQGKITVVMFCKDDASGGYGVKMATLEPEYRETAFNEDGSPNEYFYKMFEDGAYTPALD